MFFCANAFSTGILGLIYRNAADTLTHPAARICAPVLLGAALGSVVFGWKRFFKVTWNIPAFAVVLLGIFVWYTIFWGAFPLRGEFEPITFMEWEAPEILMQILAALEAAVVFLPSLYIAIRPAGVYLPRYNRWAKIQLLDYGFKPFTDYELEKLSAGDTDVFQHKPIDLTGLNRIHGVALCYADKKITEYLAFFKAGWDRQGYIEKGKLLLLAPFTLDTVEELQATLYELHRESEIFE